MTLAPERDPAPRHRRGVRSLRVTALLILLASGARPAPAQILAQVAPVESTLTVQPGIPARWAVTLRNLGNDRARVRVRLADWQMSMEGAIDLLPPGTTPVSLAEFLRFEPSEFPIGPGESVEVLLTATLPDTGPPTRHGMLLSEVRPARVIPSWAIPHTPVELGTTLFVTRSAPDGARAELAGLRVRPEGDRAFRVSVRLWNGTDRPHGVGGEVVVGDLSGAVRARGPLSRGTVPPRSLRVLSWLCEAPLLAGRYSVEARLNLGDPGPGLARTEIVWPMRGPLPHPPNATP